MEYIDKILAIHAIIGICDDIKAELPQTTQDALMEIEYFVEHVVDEKYPDDMDLQKAELAAVQQLPSELLGLMKFNVRDFGAPV